MCEFQKSRRGGRPRRPWIAPLQTPIDDALTRKEEQSTSCWSDIACVTSEHCQSGCDSSRSGSTGSSIQSVTNTPESVSHLGTITLGGVYFTRTQVHQLLSLYYVFFHTAHPCILPKWMLRLQLVSEAIATEVLLPVLLYIGSIFTSTINSAPLAVAAQDAITSAQSRPGPPSPYYLQALLLYAIAVYASNEPERGRGLLNEVVIDALSVGMNRAQFASQHGQGDPVLEESWRRTWWMIYITDAHIAGSTHTFPTQTGTVQITTDLPCEEQQYESGVSIQSESPFALSSSPQNIPPPATLRSYSVREFADVEFSSFAQLIGFTQGINRALATRRIDDIENAKAIAVTADTAMTSWCSLLPASKRRLLREDGSVDELLFKANILMHT
jgi:hypothetical protein